ncbi:MAG TPA: HD domain-containing phosphohydrolase [Methylomirabilota bacterium]|nr:HD domain-containing phosphohydrolase [Methylomirabilota bacterium]
MNEKILFVDDDANILEAYKRQLRKQFLIETAQGGEKGLEAVRTQGPFAVIVSDLRMPGMDGIQFLEAVREHAPDSVRCMLTGHADLDAAIAAVNKGNLFRFLTKPCSPEELIRALEVAVRQYQLVMAERELLEQTLTGSVQVLTEILSLVNPTAFGYASRIKRYIQHMATQLQLSNTWEFEIAAMLSQIGCVTLPAEVLRKMYADQPLAPEEQEMVAAHHKVTSELLAKIPRLETIARMIAGLQQPVDLHALVESLKRRDSTQLGTQMLMVALDFDRLVMRGVSPKAALTQMSQRKNHYLPRLLAAMQNVELDPALQRTKVVRVQALIPGMILDEDLYARNDALLLAKGHEITPSIITHLHNFARTLGVVEPFRVRIPYEIPPATPVEEQQKGKATHAA